MLTLSNEAALLIDSLVHDADLPPGAGLRIARRDDHTALVMSLTPEPGPHDEVVRDGAVTVYLGPLAAERLADQTLDAQTTAAHSAFYLRGAGE